jgi:hypothetical protein
VRGAFEFGRQWGAEGEEGFLGETNAGQIECSVSA